MAEQRRAGPLKPVMSMKLFAAWEVDRTPANCDPRLCTLTITRLTVLAPLPPGLTSVSLAAKMHSSKRTLRSNEIPLPANGALLDTELDLNFSLQYPHFVKRDGNRLQILLQRRKKYKNRTILGYKTIAEGIIRMDQVLQRSMDIELELNSEPTSSKGDKADRGNGPALPSVMARLAVHQLSSMPVDHDTKNNNTLLITDRGYSDEEEEAEFSSVEDNDEGIITSYNSNNQRRAMNYNKRDLSYNKLDRDLAFSNMDRDSYIGNKAGERDSDSEFENRQSKRKGVSRGKITQRNLKQKFVALLKRFRVPEELETGENRARGALEEEDREFDELFKELESLSCGEDSGQELDTISISSTPKPSLRPFFASSRSLVQPDSGGSAQPNTMVTSALKQQHTLDKVQQEKNVQNSNETQPTQAAKEKKHSGNSVMLTESGDQWWGRGPSGPDGSSLPYLDQDDTPDLREQAMNEVISSSPPKEKDEKKSRLFRSAVSAPSGGRKKQSLVILADQQLKPMPSEHSAQSPTNTEPRRSFLEQVSRILGTDETGVPDVITLVHPSRDGASAALLASRLAPILPQPALNPYNPLEVRGVMQSLLNKICKVCNMSSKQIQPVRVVLVGPDALVSSALRAYVDLWALRPPDWGAHVRFYIVPLGLNYISRYLASIDSGYAILFGGEGWHNLCERAVDGLMTDVNDLSNRLSRYINGSGPTVQLPIAEAMVAYREKLSDEESSQIFVPFINDVRIGAAESAQHSVDLEEALGPPGGSPPAVGLRPSPPTTPAPFSIDSVPPTPVTPSVVHWEPLELQLDYWQLAKQGDSQVKPEDMSTRKKIEGHLKSAAGVTATAVSGGVLGGAGMSGSGTGVSRGCIKSTFRCLQVARLAHCIDPQSSPSFLITYTTKEKKQKIMRLGKKKEKDKDTEVGRSQSLEGITRLICSAKSSHTPLRVYIDGAEMNSVKFFQLSMQWHTHIKNFPIALIGAPLAPAELS